MTTISVDRETKEKIKSFGSKGETFDQILRRVIEKLEVTHNE